MTKIAKEINTGGQFLLDSISDTSIFTREDFSSEHQDIFNMVMDFDRERILSQKEDIEKFQKFVDKMKKKVGKDIKPKKDNKDK